MSEQTNSTAATGGHAEPFRRDGSRTFTTIPFHGVSLVAQVGPTPEDTVVAMKPVVEGMGLDWRSQHRKLTEHPVLSKGMVVMTIPSEGGPQEMTGLALTRLNFWLATIRTERVKDVAVRERIIQYQTECSDVLFRHFFGQAVGTPEPRPIVMDIPDRSFPNWPLEEMRTKCNVTGMYRQVYGPRAAQWINPQLGWPVPPPQVIEVGRQGSLFDGDPEDPETMTVAVRFPSRANGGGGTH